MAADRTPTQPLRAVQALSVRATVALSGVDADGDGWASVGLALEAHAALTGVAVDALELLGDDHAVVARGTVRELRLATEEPVRDLGRFDGTVTAGSRVVLSAAARLDAPPGASPTRYRLRLIADRGVALELAGELAASSSHTPPRP